MSEPAWGELRARPSSFPGWLDCELRTAVRLWPRLFTDHYKIRRLTSHVGAAVGTGVHAGVASLLREKMDTGVVGALSTAEDAAQAELTQRLAEGALWDEITPRAEIAQHQVARMVRVYRQQTAPLIEPVAVEERFEAELGDGFVLSGQPDFVREPTRLVDLKTGKVPRPNGAQYGAYSLLLRAHEIDISSIAEQFLPRVDLAKPQPGVTESTYLVAAHEWAAAEVVDGMKRAVAEYFERLSTGAKPPEMAFKANPASGLCGARWCPAHGTDLCRVHKGAKG